MPQFTLHKSPCIRKHFTNLMITHFQLFCRHCSLLSMPLVCTLLLSFSGTWQLLIKSLSCTWFAKQSNLSIVPTGGPLETALTAPVLYSQHRSLCRKTLWCIRSFIFNENISTTQRKGHCGAFRAQIIAPEIEKQPVMEDTWGRTARGYWG